MSTPQPSSDQTPWYKQFWPWFLIVLPTLAVIASLYLVSIAIKNADSAVHDDYDKDGFAIQHNASADIIAAQHDLHAAVSIADGRIAVTLHGNLPEFPALLTLHFIHAFDAHRDITLALTRTSDGTYTGVLPDPAYGQWKIELRAPAASWRLAGDVELQRNGQFQLPQ